MSNENEMSMFDPWLPELRRRSCASVWLPVIEKLGILTPKTIVIKTGVELIELLDGRKPDGYDDFEKQLLDAIAVIGLPVFLRTGMTSGKHSWKDTCFLKNLGDKKLDRGSVKMLLWHLFNIVEFSECADIIGLPYDVWLVREMLPSKVILRCRNGLPISREFRVFVKDGKHEHLQAYWPAEAVKQIGGVKTPTGIAYLEEAEWEEALAAANRLTAAEWNYLRDQSETVGVALGGYWSVDWLQTQDDKWYCIDCAVGELSYKWGESLTEGQEPLRGIS